MNVSYYHCSDLRLPRLYALPLLTLVSDVVLRALQEIHPAFTLSGVWEET